MATGIFPNKDAEFNTYFGIVEPYLTANAVRLGIAPGNITALAALKASWDVKFPQSQDENTATKTIIDEKNALRDDTEDLLRDIYDDIPKSALTLADRNTLNLKERQPAAPRPHILDAPNVTLKSKGNLTIVIECRVESDSSRPSVHPDADGVELRATIGTTQPAGFEDAEKMGISSRAKINHILTNQSDAGKNIYMFARWINLSDPGKNGPWSNIAQVMIS